MPSLLTMTTTNEPDVEGYIDQEPSPKHDLHVHLLSTNDTLSLRRRNFCILAVIFAKSIFAAVGSEILAGASLEFHIPLWTCYPYGNEREPLSWQDLSRDKRAITDFLYREGCKFSKRIRSKRVGCYMSATRPSSRSQSLLANRKPSSYFKYRGSTGL
jgi:hypothetical protein